MLAKTSISLPYFDDTATFYVDADMRCRAGISCFKIEGKISNRGCGQPVAPSLPRPLANVTIRGLKAALFGIVDGVTLVALGLFCVYHKKSNIIM